MKKIILFVEILIKNNSTVILLFISMINIEAQTFSDHNILTTGSMPDRVHSLSVADFNNDGNFDIIFNRHRENDNKLYLLKNKGNDEFENLEEIILEYYFDNFHIVRTSDLDNDGLTDIIISRIEKWNQILWFRNTGDFNFKYKGPIFNFSYWNTIYVDYELVDLNGDSIDDMITGREHLFINMNSGNGTFSEPDTLVNDGNLLKFYCSDIDSDGDKDIVYNTNYPDKIGVFFNNGVGEFHEDLIVDSIQQDLSSTLHVFDIENDMDMDIMVFAEDSLVLFLNNGENAFSPKKTPKDSLFFEPKSTLVDYDNDGDMDIVSSRFDILENMGNGNLEFKPNHQQFPKDLLSLFCKNEICDFDYNNDEDIVFGMALGGIGYIKDFSFENIINWMPLTSSVMSPENPAFGDVNGDGLPDICTYDNNYKYVFYLNKGNGVFIDTICTEKLHTKWSTSYFYDINKDGLLDIASYLSHNNYLPDDPLFKLASNNGDSSFTTNEITDYDYFYRLEAYYNENKKDSTLDVFLVDIPYSGTILDTIYRLNILSDFSVKLKDTIIFDHRLYLDYYFNLKFFDMDHNGEDDIIIHSKDTIFGLFSHNGVFDDSLKLLVFTSDDIYDFNMLMANNNTNPDLFFHTKQGYTNLYLDYDGNSFQSNISALTDEEFWFAYAFDINGDSIDEIFECTKTKIRLYNDFINDDKVYEEYPYRQYNLTILHDGLISCDIDKDGDIDILSTNRTNGDISWFENSQYCAPFPEDNAIWTEQNSVYDGNNNTWTSLFLTESDTTLLNNKFTNIYEYYLDQYSFDTIRQLYASVRQAKAEKRTYIIRHYLSETDEKILLDFNVTIGDTFLLDAYYWDEYPLYTDSIFIVDSIASIELVTLEKRDALYLSNHNKISPVNLILIEGIGSILNPFGPINTSQKNKSVNSEITCDYLICHSVNNEILYIKDSTERCNTLEVWTGIHTENNKSIKLFPNPAKSYFTFESLAQEINEIKIYDQLNNKVSNYNCTNGVVDISNLAPGFYVIEMLSENQIYFGKLIKK